MRGRSVQNLLFYEGSFSAVIEAQQKSIIKDVEGLNGDRVLSTPVPDLVSYYSQRFTIDVPILQMDKAEVEQSEANVLLTDTFRYNLPRGPVEVPGISYALRVPFTGDEILFRVRPNTSDLAPPRAEVVRGGIVIRLAGRELTAGQVNDHFDGVLADIERYLGWQRESADPFNADLPNFVRGYIEQRRAKLLRDKQTLAGLNFPVRQRVDAPKTFVAPEVRKKVLPTLPPASREAFKPEPALDDATYKHILSVIENMTHVMERSPTAFASMDEEALRQHFLVQLNGQFEGTATGETFNYNGKTDILIRAQDRNIFIGECKFWRGEKAFGETIDQILGYLSWRDTKAAILLFNRQKDFSRVVEKARETMGAHQHRKRGPQHEGETRSRYVFGNPDDHNREIVLTLLAFDVPT